MTMRGINPNDLDKETRDRLGISVMPSVEQAGIRHIALGKVLKALKNLEEEDVLWILQQAKLQYAQQGEVEQGNGNGYTPPISWIMKVVSSHYKITVAELKQRSRKQEVVVARQVVMFLCWSYEKYTLNEIGQALGGRSPATISHGFSNIAKQIRDDNRLKENIERIKGGF